MHRLRYDDDIDNTTRAGSRGARIPARLDEPPAPAKDQAHAAIWPAWTDRIRYTITTRPRPRAMEARS